VLSFGYVAYYLAVSVWLTFRTARGLVPAGGTEARPEPPPT
jgi:hypothetical protein